MHKSVEDLDAADGQARVDLGAGEAIGDGVIVGVDVDVIVDADPAHAPLAVFIGLARQRLERRAIDLLEQLAAGDAEPARLCLSGGRKECRPDLKARSVPPT